MFGHQKFKIKLNQLYRQDFKFLLQNRINIEGKTNPLPENNQTFLNQFYPSKIKF
jgi:hypothetical protein